MEMLEFLVQSSALVILFTCSLNFHAFYTTTTSHQIYLWLLPVMFPTFHPLRNVLINNSESHYSCEQLCKSVEQPRLVQDSAPHSCAPHLAAPGFLPPTSDIFRDPCMGVG